MAAKAYKRTKRASRKRNRTDSGDSSYRESIEIAQKEAAVLDGKRIQDAQDAKRKSAVAYTPEIGERIITGLIEGRSVNKICQGDDMPSSRSVRKWSADPAHPLSKEYLRAREIGLTAIADELIDLADTANSENYNAIRLRVDARKWILSKQLPSTYGDRSDLHVKAEVTSKVQLPSDRELARLLASLASDAEEPIPLIATDVTDDDSSDT